MISMVTADYLLDSQGVWEEMEARGLVPANQPGARHADQLPRV